MTFEGLLGARPDGTPTGMKEVVHRAVQALRTIDVDFAMIGSVALGLHGHRRFTEDIDFLVEPDRWREASRALREAGFETNPDGPAPDDFLARFVDPETGVGIDLMFAVGDPEESAREMAVPKKIFGLTVKVARPEFLLWMLLLSDQPRHLDDAAALLRKKLVDTNALISWLQAAGDQEALDQLRKVTELSRQSPHPKRRK